MDVAQVDLINISNLAERLLKSIDNRKSLHDYLHSKMGAVAPNLSELIGDQVSYFWNQSCCYLSKIKMLNHHKL